MVNGEPQLNGDGTVCENLREADKGASQSSTTTAPKMLMVINKDGSKTIMTLVTGKNTSESDSASSLVADASNDSQDSNSGAGLFLIIVLELLSLCQCNNAFSQNILDMPHIKWAFSSLEE